MTTSEVATDRTVVAFWTVDGQRREAEALNPGDWWGKTWRRGGAENRRGRDSDDSGARLERDHNVP